MERPLENVRILDFTIMMQGPEATQMLADLGADVIKVERPARLGGPSGRPDQRYGPTGAYGSRPEENTWSASSFLAHNRNKKSITVDLKQEKGQEIIRRLIRSSDVVYENFRPDVMPRLGFGYADCCKINPSIICASASGYGPEGPYVARPGQDLLAQALSGIETINAPSGGRPMAIPYPIVDLLGAMYGAYAVLGALYYRQVSGQGQQVSVCLLDSAIASLSELAVHYLNTGVEPDRGSPMHATPYITSPYGVYKTKDGFIAISGSHTTAALSKVLGIPSLLDDPRFDGYGKQMANRAEMDGIIEEALQKRTTAEWMPLMREADLWAAPVKGFSEVFTDPQVVHNEMVVMVDSPIGPLKLPGIPYKLSKTPAQIRTAPPLLGQHTDEVLKGIGYSPKEIAELRDEQII